MKNFNVSYYVSAESDMTYIDIKVDGADRSVLEYLEHRIDNYYDANGLLTIDIVDDVIEAGFVNENSPGGIVESVKDYVEFILDNL